VARKRALAQRLGDLDICLVEDDGGDHALVAPTKMVRRLAWAAPMKLARGLAWEVVTSRLWCRGDLRVVWQRVILLSGDRSNTRRFSDRQMEDPCDTSTFDEAARLLDTTMYASRSRWMGSAW
jgi:hypothetical protein